MQVMEIHGGEMPSLAKGFVAKTLANSPLLETILVHVLVDLLTEPRLLVIGGAGCN